MKVKIFYHHTDCGGVVYYAEYLKFLEEARTEFLEERGISIRELAEQGTLFVVARQEIDYKASAFYADMLTVSARICGLGAAKIEFSHQIKNQEGLIISLAKTVLVCVGRDLKPKPIDEGMRNVLLKEVPGKDA